jgi:hypothetical protein
MWVAGDACAAAAGDASANAPFVLIPGLEMCIAPWAAGMACVIGASRRVCMAAMPATRASTIRSRARSLATCVRLLATLTTTETGYPLEVSTAKGIQTNRILFHSQREPRVWVDGCSVDQNSEVKVGSGACACTADKPDELANFHLIADVQRERPERHMAIDAADGPPFDLMIDDGVDAEGARWVTDFADDAIGDRMDRHACSWSHIQSLVF